MLWLPSVSTETPPSLLTQRRPSGEPRGETCSEGGSHKEELGVI